MKNKQPRKTTTKKIDDTDVELSITINNRDINLFLIDSLIMDIKKKKEFSSIDEELVFNEVVKSIKKSSKKSQIFSEKSLEKLQRSKEYKEIVKEVRKTLHRIYGMFQKEDKQKRKTLLEELKFNLDKKKTTEKKVKEIHDKILKLHSSTEERLNLYPDLYKKIFRFTGKPKKILDIGCGLNPVSLPYMKLKDITYTAVDISIDDIDFLENYFSIIEKHYKVKYKTEILNLLPAKKENVFKAFKKHDIAFFFKILEILELNKKHKISENLIKTVPARWVVVSFPTKTLTKKLMNYIRRGWLRMMLERLNYAYHIITTSNELFFVIDKESENAN